MCPTKSHDVTIYRRPWRTTPRPWGQAASSSSTTAATAQHGRRRHSRDLPAEAEAGSGVDRQPPVLGTARHTAANPSRRAPPLCRVTRDAGRWARPTYTLHWVPAAGPRRAGAGAGRAGPTASQRKGVSDAPASTMRRHERS